MNRKTKFSCARVVACRLLHSKDIRKRTLLQQKYTREDDDDDDDGDGEGMISHFGLIHVSVS